MSVCQPVYPSVGLTVNYKPLRLERDQSRSTSARFCFFAVISKTVLKSLFIIRLNTVWWFRVYSTFDRKIMNIYIYIYIYIYILCLCVRVSEAASYRHELPLSPLVLPRTHIINPRERAAFHLSSLDILSTDIILNTATMSGFHAAVSTVCT